MALRLEEVPSFIWMFVVVGIMAALGILILSELGDSLDTSDSYSVNNETITIVDQTSIVEFANPNTGTNWDFGNYTGVVVMNASVLENESFLISSPNYTLTNTGLIMQSGEFNDTVNVSYTWQALNVQGTLIENSTEGIANITEQLPTVGVVVGVAIIIGIILLLMVYFGKGRDRTY